MKYKLCDRYKVIFCDIDDTLISGFITDLMSITWNLFHSEFIGELLMRLQAKLQLCKINSVLLHSMGRGLSPDTTIVFLTARAESKSTYQLIEKIMDNPYNFHIVAIGTDNIAVDKIQYILDECEDNNIPVNEVCIVDDNESVRHLAEKYHIDAYNPEWFTDD